MEHVSGHILTLHDQHHDRAPDLTCGDTYGRFELARFKARLLRWVSSAVMQRFWFLDRRPPNRRVKWSSWLQTCSRQVRGLQLPELNLKYRPSLLIPFDPPDSIPHKKTADTTGRMRPHLGTAPFHSLPDAT